MSEQVLKIASWNIRDGLSDVATMPSVVERIKGLEADIVALPEAFSERARSGDEQKAEVLADAAQQLTAEGYQVNRLLYGDTDDRKDRHGFALLTRRMTAGDTVRVFDLESRRTLGQCIGELSLTVVGVHLDDRREATRRQQADTLLAQLGHTQHSVVLGDFNAMHKDDTRARLLRTARPFAALLPSVDPGEKAPNLAKLRRIGSLGQRLTGMAEGSVMHRFEAAGYQDVDLDYQPTKGPVQLDHILTNAFSINNQPSTRPDWHWMSVGQYRVHDTPKTESDHRPISAVIEY